MSSLNYLYIITGMPAAGKSTFARELAQHAKACLIDIDTSSESIIRAAMQQLTGNPDDRDSPTFKETFRSPIYDTLFAIADENLPHTDVIITGPFTKELANPIWLAEVRARMNTPCKIKGIFVHCAPELRKKRLIERANPRDSSKLEDWDNHLKYYDPNAFPSYPHFRVDTGAQDYFKQALDQGLID